MKSRKVLKYKGIWHGAWGIGRKNSIIHPLLSIRFPYALCPMPYALMILFCLTLSSVASDSWNADNPNGFEVIYRGTSQSKLGGLRIWGGAYYDNTKIEPEQFVPMTSDMTGLMAGLEFKRKGGSIFGLYYHYAGEDTKWDLDIINGKVKHNLVGLTFHKPMRLCHFLMNLNGGLDDYRLNFPIGDEIKPKGYQANFYPQFGFDIPLGKMIGLKPYVALHYHYLHHDEIAPIGPLEKADYHGLNNLLGMRTNLVLSVITLQARASWVHEYMETTPTSQSYFSSLPGQFTPIRCNFVGSTARDWAWLGVGAKLGYGGFRLFADYDLTLNARQTSHTISACLCFGW